MQIFNINLDKKWGGTEQACLDYSVALQRNGCNVTSILLSKSIGVVKHKSHNLAVRCIGKYLSLWPLMRQEFQALVKELEPEIIILHGGKALRMLQPVVKRLGLPTIGVTHLDKTYKVSCDYVIATTEYLRQKELAKRAAKVSVSGPISEQPPGQNSEAISGGVFFLPNMIDLQKIDTTKLRQIPTGPKELQGGSLCQEEARALPKINQKLTSKTPTGPQSAKVCQSATFSAAAKGSPVVIGAIGRLIEAKGFDILLGALAKLRGQGAKFKAVIAGDGPHLVTLKSLTNKLNLTNQVEFIGWCEDKAAFYRNIDVFVLPSRYEPFGLVLLEAMAYSKPVIASKSEGPRAILTHQQNALLYDIEDAAALASSLSEVIAQPALAASMVTSARGEVVDKYSTAKLGPQLKQILQRVLNDRL